MKARNFWVCLLAAFVWMGIPGVSLAGHSSKGLKILEEIERGLVGLAEHTLPAVVNLSPYVPPSPSIRRQDDQGQGRPTNAGAGVIIDGARGYIVTNSHVVKKADKVQVTLYDGRELVGKVLGADEETDLAVVQVETDKPLRGVDLGDSSRLKVGQLVFAIGNPYGLHDTFSMGVVSGLNRENINISRYEDFIQTDASINPGNSGGPLLNIQGEVIGINTAIINYAQSIGFAIPSNVVRNVTRQIIDAGAVQRGWLGVGIDFISEKVAAREKISTDDGILVNSVFDDQPAAQAGIQVGDIILKIGGRPVNSPAGMIRLIGNISPGQSVQIEILRKGERKLYNVVLARRIDPREQVAATRLNALTSWGAQVADLTPDLRIRYGLRGEGVVVTEVYSASNADRGGLREGDRIDSIEGQRVTSKEEFERIMNQLSGKEKVGVLVERQGLRVNLNILVE